MDDLVQQTGMIHFWKRVREQLFCLNMEKELCQKALLLLSVQQ